MPINDHIYHKHICPGCGYEKECFLSSPCIDRVPPPMMRRYCDDCLVEMAGGGLQRGMSRFLKMAQE